MPLFHLCMLIGLLNCMSVPLTQNKLCILILLFRKGPLPKHQTYFLGKLDQMHHFHKTREISISDLCVTKELRHLFFF